MKARCNILPAFGVALAVLATAVVPAMVAMTYAFEQATAQSVPAGTREVPARLLPVPDTVSPQMQAIIARPFNPDYNLTPETIADWKKRVEDGARRVKATLPKIRAALDVSVESTTMGGGPGLHRYSQVDPAE
jgi:epsilon-lactone hydrolase